MKRSSEVDWGASSQYDITRTFVYGVRVNSNSSVFDPTGWITCGLRKRIGTIDIHQRACTVCRSRVAGRTGSKVGINHSTDQRVKCLFHRTGENIGLLVVLLLVLGLVMVQRCSTNGIYCCL